MNSNHALSALAVATLSGAALAQATTVLLRVGDSIPGAGKITHIEAVEANDGVHWTALVHTDDPVAHSVLFADGTPHIKVGDTPPGLGGAAIAALDPPTTDFFQAPTYIARLSGSSSSQAVMYAGIVQLWTGKSTSPSTTQLPPSSTWRRFDELHFAWSNGGFLVRGAIDDPLTGTFDLSFAAVAWQGGTFGGCCYVDVIALEGQLAPGLARSIEEIRAGPGHARLNRHGTISVWSCDLDGSTTDDSCVYSTASATGSTSLIAREGSPSPVAGRAWGALEDHALDTNGAGAWTLRGRLDGSDPTNDEVLVRGSTVLAREGLVLPATAPYPLTTLGQGRGALDDHGRVLWFGAWDDPRTAGVDEALFLDGALLVQTGKTDIAGAVLVDLDSDPHSYSFDPHYGRYVAFIGSLANGTRGAFLLDLAVVEAYCVAKPNSLGVEPALQWGGQPPSASIGSGFAIQASSLAAKVPSVFFYGTDGPLAQPFHGGTLCVQPPLRRAKAQSTAGTSGATGFASMDFNAWIASGVDPKLVAGSRVHLQLWYRDPGFPPPDDVGMTAGLAFQLGP